MSEDQDNLLDELLSRINRPEYEGDWVPPAVGREIARRLRLTRELADKVLALVDEVERLGAERRRWISDYTGAIDPNKILSALHVAERERDEAREALRYVIDVRRIKCEHQHPPPDEYCAKCRADEALTGGGGVTDLKKLAEEWLNNAGVYDPDDIPELVALLEQVVKERDAQWEKKAAADMYQVLANRNAEVKRVIEEVRLKFPLTDAQVCAHRACDEILYRLGLDR